MSLLLRMRARGEDPAKNLERAIDADNGIIAGLRGATFGLHICRGNRARLALSPQCGFASGIAGNPLTEDEQWRKLDVMLETARQVWGQL